jgi:cob(I)alamin adenosyltransferase
MIPIALPHLSGEFQVLYEEAKYWLSIGTAIWTILKIMSWVKKIKESDLVNIQSGVNNLNAELVKQTTTLNTELVKQTTAIVSELKEMRNDFRTFYVPVLTVAPARRQPGRTTTKKVIVKKQVEDIA